MCEFYLLRLVWVVLKIKGRAQSPLKEQKTAVRLLFHTFGYINKIIVNVGELYFRGFGIKLHFSLYYYIYIYPVGFIVYSEPVSFPRPQRGCC